jgi:hypothetical protein
LTTDCFSSSVKIVVVLKWKSHVSYFTVVRLAFHSPHWRCLFHSWKQTVGFEFLMALTIRSTVIQDVTPCSLADSHQHFGGPASSIFRRWKQQIFFLNCWYPSTTHMVSLSRRQ